MARRTQRHTIQWQDLTDEEILQLRVRDLNVRIEGSELESCIRQLYEELAGRGVRFRPPCYLADEWLCPDKEPIIGIPFCLSHPRLKQIEQKMMYEVEGGDRDECMRLLRHECGHAINYAYELFRRTRWRELFGPFSLTYSDTYQYQPYSRRYVLHLANNYAQSHPDEDFAETFAVWLTPGNDWRTKYRDWPAMRKLQYVDGLMQRIGDQEPTVAASPNPPWAAERMRSTLDAYYVRKRRALGREFQGYYDDSLQRVFGSDEDDAQRIKASRLLRNHRRRMTHHVARWTGHRKYDIHELVGRLIQRCDALDLYVQESSEADSIVAATALLTTIAGNTLPIGTKGK